jgi:pimeloyl-ACP methyl ester carboxylesterase
MLLTKEGLTGPYILIGHSAGGPTVRLYATTYPNEVTGVVLVDSSHEDQIDKMPPLIESSFLNFLLTPTVATSVASTGIFRVFYQLPVVQETLKKFPVDVRKMYISKKVTTKSIHTLSKESAIFEKSMRQVKESVESLGDKPLIVITAGKPMIIEDNEYLQKLLDKTNTAWQFLQKDLVTKSTQGKQMIAKQSGHMIPLEQPEIIVEAAREQISFH